MTSLAQSVPAEIVAVVQAAERVALIGHVTPDADCLGALGGLALALRQRGKTVRVSLPVGTVSRKLTAFAELAGLHPATTAELAACDLAIVVDTAREKRVNLDGKLDALPNVPVLNIDHHATNTRFGAHNWVESAASSASELVYRLLLALGTDVTPAMASLLYAGLHSDTQGFSLATTTPASLEAGLGLARAGADIAAVCERLHRSHSPAEFALRRIIHDNTRISPDGRLAWSTASHAEIVGAGCSASDIDDEVEIPRSIEGVLVAILLTEGDVDRVRINFRGEQGVSVLPLAEQFGGGGHVGSAGAIRNGDCATVTEEVIGAALAFVAALEP